jgi:integrase
MASIRKRTWKLGDEQKTAWVVDYFDQAGTRRLKTFTKKKDADAWLTTAAHQVSQGTHTADSASITVEEAGKLWIEQSELDQLERATIEQREAHLRLHINPRIGAEKLSRLTAPAVKEFTNDLIRSMSRALAAMVLRSLKMAIGNAMTAGKVAQNVAAGVKIKAKSREDEEVTIPTKAEWNAIVAEASGRWRPLFVTAAFTGMRASELRGLRWSAVDFERRVIRVDQRADKWGSIGDPKSSTSRREIPMMPAVVTTLLEWRKECPKGELGLVFPNLRGNVEMHTNVLKRGWYPTLLAAGVFDRTIETAVTEDGFKFCEVRPAYGFHALRHFYASLIIESGFQPKKVQALLGHSSIQMTFDTYGHLFSNLDDDHARLADIEQKLLRAV